MKFLPSEDSTELRIYSTTIPTEYRIYTLMHDPVYRLGIAWQNVAYNQPPHISFYLGEDIRDKVLAGELSVPNIFYAGQPDTSAPTAPGNLRIADTGTTTVTLVWNASEDNTAVDGYEIYVNGSLHGKTGNLSYTVTGLVPGTEYTFTVYAYDTSGNRSEGASVKGTTRSADSSSGSGQSRQSAEPKPTPSPVPAEIPKQTVNVSEPVVNEATGAVSVSIDKNDINSAFENAQPDENGVKTVLAEIPETEGADSYLVSLDASVLTNAASANKKIELKTPLGTLIIPGNMLANSYTSKAGEITVRIGKANTGDIPDDIKAVIGERPVIELSLYLNGNPIEFNNPYTLVSVSIPYTPTEEELEEPGNIVVWYIGSSGKAEPVPTGWYNAETGMVEFRTSHFSKYAVAHFHKTFGDLDGYEWAKKEIEILAARGIIKGTSPTTYKPGDNLTRADFTLLLVRALGLNTRVVSVFSDVRPTDYFYEGMGIAKALGIVKGTGNNMGNPREEITRQEMMVMAARALRYAGKLEEGSAEDLENIFDINDIADYAVSDIAALVRMGMVPEREGNAIRPAERATRAEAALLIYRLCKK